MRRIGQDTRHRVKQVVEAFLFLKAHHRPDDWGLGWNAELSAQGDQFFLRGRWILVGVDAVVNDGGLGGWGVEMLLAGAAVFARGAHAAIPVPRGGSGP